MREVGPVHAEVEPAHVKDEVHHEGDGEELQPDVGGDRRHEPQHVDQRDVDEADGIDREPNDQRTKDLVVVHRAEERGGEQEEEGGEMPAEPLFERDHHDEGGDGEGAQHRVDEDLDADAARGPLVLAGPLGDAARHADVEQVGQQDGGVEQEGLGRVDVDRGEQGGGEEDPVPLPHQDPDRIAVIDDLLARRVQEHAAQALHRRGMCDGAHRYGPPFRWFSRSAASREASSRTPAGPDAPWRGKSPRIARIAPDAGAAARIPIAAGPRGPRRYASRWTGSTVRP